MPAPAFFSDLDNTLIFSARHLREDSPEVTAVEIYPDKLGGYMTLPAHKLLGRISQEAIFIPVTARHDVQYNRLQWPHVSIRHAVLGNGAIMMLDGERLASWDTHIRTRAMAEHTASLTDLQSAISERLQLRHLAYEVDVIENLFCVYIMDSQALPEDLLPELLPVVENMGYRMSLQHRKLHLVPKWLSKGEALTSLRDELNLSPVYAAGDAILDGPMVEAADHGWIPAGSEIAGNYPSDAGITITEHPSLLGGERILRDVAARLGINWPQLLSND